MMTSGYQSDSSEDTNFDKIEGYMKKLKEKKGSTHVDKARHQQSSHYSGGNKIQSKLDSLEELIKKTANGVRVRHWYSWYTAITL